MITRPSRIELKKELNEKNAINQLSPLTLAFLAATNRIVEQAKKNSKEKIRVSLTERANRREKRNRKALICVFNVLYSDLASNESGSRCFETETDKMN